MIGANLLIRKILAVDVSLFQLLEIYSGTAWPFCGNGGSPQSILYHIYKQDNAGIVIF